MKLLAAGLFLVGLICIVFFFKKFDSGWLSHPDPFFSFRSKTNAPEKSNLDFWLFPGDSEITIEKQRIEEYYSIEGLCSLSGLKVDVIVLEPNGASTGNSLPFRVFENIEVKTQKPYDSWGESIRSKYETKSYKIHSSLEIVLKSMPKDDDLWGRKAKFVITGEYLYPLTSSDNKFVENRTPKFREEIPFRFAERAEKDKYESGLQVYDQEKAKVKAYNDRIEWLFFVARSIGILLSFGLIGISIWIFIRAKRAKLKTS